jgi:hypothetical protein
LHSADILIAFWAHLVMIKADIGTFRAFHCLTPLLNERGHLAISKHV